MSLRGAYLLYLDLKGSQTLRAGSLGEAFFPAGRYVYVGSARRGIAARVRRHKRLAVEKKGKLHWHIDFLLVHPQTKWAGEEVIEDGIECKISKQISAVNGVTVPVPGFGSSDCHSGCQAHLYLLPSAKPVFRLETEKLGGPSALFAHAAKFPGLRPRLV